MFGSYNYVGDPTYGPFNNPKVVIERLPTLPPKPIPIPTRLPEELSLADLNNKKNLDYWLKKAQEGSKMATDIINQYRAEQAKQKNKPQSTQKPTPIPPKETPQADNSGKKSSDNTMIFVGVALLGILVFSRKKKKKKK